MIDLKDRTFGRLVVVSRGKLSGHNRYWLCRCSCGREFSVRQDNLTRGRSRSCGCDRRKASPKMRGREKEYASWHAMVDRCTNPRNHAYTYYGGRGITVWPPWEKSFEQFYHDLGPRPAGMTLGRVDNEKGYFPENCRWETRKSQMKNRSNASFVQWQGRSWQIIDISEATGVPYSLLYGRIRMGWDVEKAVTTPARSNIPKPTMFWKDSSGTRHLTSHGKERLEEITSD